MKIKRMTLICLIISAFGGIAGAIFRTVALLNNYDSASGHFMIGDPQPVLGLSWAFPVICVLAVCALCIGCRKRLKEKRIIHGINYTVGAFAAAMTSLIVFFESVSSIAAGTAFSRGLEMGIAVFAVLSCVTVLAGALIPAKGVNLLRAGVSLTPALFIMLPGFRAYFDPELVMNCPNKNVYIIAACFTALSVIAECRFNTAQPKPLWFVICCCGAVSFGLLCAIPDLIYLAANKTSLLRGWGADAAIFGFAVFSALRLISVRNGAKILKKADE